MRIWEIGRLSASHLPAKSMSNVDKNAPVSELAKWRQKAGANIRNNSELTLLRSTSGQEEVLFLVIYKVLIDVFSSLRLSIIIFVNNLKVSKIGMLKMQFTRLLVSTVGKLWALGQEHHTEFLHVPSQNPQ